MTLRGVQNLYLAGLTIRNPAFHGVMVLESENITLNGLVHQTFDGNNADGVEFGNSKTRWSSITSLIPEMIALILPPGLVKARKRFISSRKARRGF